MSEPFQPDDGGEPVAASHPASARCRPDAGMWLLFVLTAGMGAASAIVPMKGPHPIAGPDLIFMECCAAIWYVPALFLFIWLVKAAIIADERGLRWRGMLGWRFAAWDGVTDYYDKVMRGGGPNGFVVETAAGRLLCGGKHWAKLDTLRSVVERYATNARVKSAGLQGERGDVDLPMTFDYQDFNNRSMPWMLRAAGIAFGALVVERSIAVYTAYSRVGWSRNVTDLAMKTLFYVTLEGVLILVFAYAARQVKCRMNQRITARGEGVFFEDGAYGLFMTWDEITSYSVTRDPKLRFIEMPVREVTGAGRSFYFTHAIRDAVVLESIISTHSMNTGTKQWRNTISDTVGRSAATGCDVRAQEGKQIYHYRTRSLRALLVLAWFYASLWPLIALIELLLTGAPPPSVPALMPCSAAAALCAWWLWRVYRHSFLRIGDKGIESKTPFRTVFIPWEDVRDYSWQSDSKYVPGKIVSSHGCIRFSDMITDFDDLKDEIARRAVNSRNKSWDVKKAAAQP